MTLPQLPYLLPATYCADRERRGLPMGSVSSRAVCNNRWQLWLSRAQAEELLTDAELRGATDLTYEMGCAGAVVRASSRRAALRLRQKLEKMYP